MESAWNESGRSVPKDEPKRHAKTLGAASGVGAPICVKGLWSAQVRVLRRHYRVHQK